MLIEGQLTESRDNDVQLPKNTGRPKGSTKLKLTDDTIKQIQSLSRIQCTQREAAAVLGVHVDSFRAFLNRHQKALEAWEDGSETGKASLRRAQHKNAMEGNSTMQIWLGKQWLDQRDVSEVLNVNVDFDSILRARLMAAKVLPAE